MAWSPTAGHSRSIDRVHDMTAAQQLQELHIAPTSHLPPPRPRQSPDPRQALDLSVLHDTSVIPKPSLLTPFPHGRDVHIPPLRQLVPVVATVDAHARQGLHSRCRSPALRRPLSRLLRPPAALARPRLRPRLVSAQEDRGPSLSDPRARRRRERHVPPVAPEQRRQRQGR